MKILYLSVFFLFLSPGCKISYKLLKSTEATVLYEFERVYFGGGDAYYFYKSASCLVKEGIYDEKSGTYTINPEWHDLLGYVSDQSTLASELVNKLNKKHNTNSNKNSPSGTYFFSKKLGEIEYHYSDYIYNHHLDENTIYIIFKIKGDIALVKNISDDAIFEYNKKYTCPILYNKLNLPFYKVVSLIESSPPSETWLSRNGYHKMPIDSFRINFCD